MTYTQWKSPSGMHVMMEDMPSMVSATASFFVLGGARSESDKQIGIAHALEHLLFRGSLHYPDGAMGSAFAQTTGHINAFTTWEYTCFYSRSIPEELPSMFSVLIDMLRYPLLRTKDFNLEQAIIRRELSRQSEEARSRLTHRLHQHVYPGRLGKLLIGSDEEISKMNIAGLEDFHKLNYIPSNILLVISGNIKSSKTIDSCLQMIRSWENTRLPIEIEPPLTVKPQLIDLAQAQTEPSYAVWAWNLSPLEDKHHYAVHLLCTLLGDDNYIGSRFYNEIVVSGLAQQITCVYSVFGGKGLFKIYGLAKKDQLNAVREKILNEMRQIAAGNITWREYNRAKQKVKTQMALDASSSHSRAVSIAQAWMRHRRMVTLDELLSFIDQITLGDLRDVAARQFDHQEYFEIRE
ncbi:pitrilysin family protein [Saccharibacillus sp. CPCC 101409]|uniref:M16 family metallopeptidase n=1 Tax=Saccharibacillus sp. CPCC 101409 TaxID=3058041 RepID=UPI0026736C7E|nr:pitrilysin family protein [Saccharibacillus sp. CPCC 101409]MDO3409722.1 pitrilysin family protein [Saccharibacillus sp. CPCC 101409]